MTVESGHKAGRGDYGTPIWLFEKIQKVYQLNVDACADDENHKLEKYFTETQDGLKQDWLAAGGRCFMNPPYGRDIVDLWVQKAYQESLRGCLVVGLLPVDPSTGWWRDWVRKADHINYLPKRIRFIGAPGSPTFSSCLAVWGLNLEIRGVK